MQGKRWWFRLHEKGGKLHDVPAHHNAVDYMDSYLEAAEIWEDRKGPLFRTLDRRLRLTDRRLDRREVAAMIKRRSKRAGLPDNVSCHTFRATGITTYLQNGGTVEKAQQIAAHESPRTTKLYDRTSDEISLDEVERIIIYSRRISDIFVRERNEWQYNERNNQDNNCNAAPLENFLEQ